MPKYQMKICSKCEKKKRLSQFYKCSSRKDGHTSSCKECRKLLDEQRKDLIKDYIKVYTLKNSKIISKKRKLQRSTKEHKLKRQNYERDRYSTDINYKIKSILRSRILVALKSNQKSGSTIKNLGCSIDNFKVYLESKFKDGMTWDNHGIHGWHIDHVIPLAQFDLTNKDEFLKAVHYTNLQPLWSVDNWRKADKIHA